MKILLLQELLKVVYVDKELAFIKDLDISRTMENKENTSYDGKNGVRCIRISPDGKHLASGDRSGNGISKKNASNARIHIM